MREWKPGGKSHDDGLDAVAGCLLAQPIRMNVENLQKTVQKRIEWRPQKDMCNGSVDFCI